MTVNVPNAQSVRVGGHVYQVNVSQAQVDARNIDRERARQLSRETSRRRRALEDRRQQVELREERKRQAELSKRREKQREATERYQRAHIPQRRRFSSPVLDKAYSAPALNADSNLHSLSDTRFQSARARRVLVNRDDVEKHTARTLQSRAAFNDQFQSPNPYDISKVHQPQPPTYPRPVSIKTAWDSETQTAMQPAISQPRIPLEPRDPSPIEDAESESDEGEENSTFIVEHLEQPIVKRCSTPEPIEPTIQSFVPQPPECPKPPAVNPRNAKILSKYVEFQKAQQEDQKRYEEEVTTVVQSIPLKQFSDPPKPSVAEVKPAEPTENVFLKGILKRRVSRRIVSASGNRGIIAASIRDSLDMLHGKSADGQRAKSVRWDRLYYNDDTVAEFATDGKPKAVPEKVKKSKSNRRVPIKKAQMKPSPPQTDKSGGGVKGKKGKKIKKSIEKVSDINNDAIMQYRHTSYTVAPTPSAATMFKTETPQFKPDYNQMMSSRIPMPPTVARPLTSRTQILRSKRVVTTTNPLRAPPKPVKGAEPNYIVNSNNQLNIHIGSLELSPELNRTPTDSDITWLWERVRTVLENQQKTNKRNRPSSTIPKSSKPPAFTKSRPHSAHVNSSSAAFALAEQLARRGVTDDRIMDVINHPQTAMSLEEQQIEQSLQRLDDRLLHIQETAGFNGIAFHNRH